MLTEIILLLMILSLATGVAALFIYSFVLLESGDFEKTLLINIFACTVLFMGTLLISAIYLNDYKIRCVFISCQ